MYLKKNKKSELKRISLLIILTFLVTILIASANNFTGPINITTNGTNETIITPPTIPIPPLEPECINDSDCDDQNPLTFDYCRDNLCSYLEIECLFNEDCDDNNESTLGFCIDNFCIYEPININQTNQTQPKEPVQIPPEPPQQPVPEPIPIPEPVQPIPGPQPQPIPGPQPIPECQEDIDCDDNNNLTLDSCIEGNCSYQEIECLFNEDCDDNNNETIDICIDYFCFFNQTQPVPECINDTDCDDQNHLTLDYCRDNICSHVEVECINNTDCDDNNNLTFDYCRDNLCSYLEIECLFNEDCDDNNESTDDFCIDNLCISNQINTTNITEPEILLLEQGEAQIGFPVKWKAKIKAQNIEQAKNLLPFDSNFTLEQELEEENNTFYFEYETPIITIEEQDIEQETKVLAIIQSDQSNQSQEKLLKRVTIRSNFSGHYHNVKASTTIILENEENETNAPINIYHLINQSNQTRTDITEDPIYNLTISEVLNDVNSTNETNPLNTQQTYHLSWIVPELSEQIFEITGGGSGGEGPIILDALPDNQSDELWLNMTGNVLLFHFDNNSRLGENSSVVKDFSGRGNNGSVGNATYTSDGKVNGSYGFNGTTDSIDCGDDDSLDFGNNKTGEGTDFTISAWYNMTILAPDEVMLVNKRRGGSPYEGWDIKMHSSNRMYFTIHDGTTQLSMYKSVGVSLNTWHHIVVSCNRSNECVMYVEGVNESSLNISKIGNISNNINLRIGRASITDGFEWNGTIDEVAIFNRSLSANEVKQLYQAGLGKRGLSACGDLEADSSYILVDDVVGDTTCFNITGNNIELDCAGYTINYSDSGVGYAINNTGQEGNGYDNITIKNCVIKETTAGHTNAIAVYWRGSNSTIENNTITTLSQNANPIYLYYSFPNDNVISNNTLVTSGVTAHAFSAYTSDNNIIENNKMNASGASAHGAYFYKSIDNNTINNNTINAIDGGYGIQLNDGPSGNRISNNTISTTGSKDYGIYLLSSSNNNVSDNKINTSQTNSLIIYGTTIAHYNHTIDETNLAEGNAVNYTFNAQDTTYDASVDSTWNDKGQIACGWCNNVTYDNIVHDDGDGINLFHTTYSNIYNSNITTSKGYGIYLYYLSEQNNITNNTIGTSGSYGYGIYANDHVDYNRFENNTIDTSNSYGYGMYLYDCDNCEVKNSSITTTNTRGRGIDTTLSDSLTISGCDISTAGYDAYGLHQYSGSKNIIKDSVISATYSSPNGDDLYGTGSGYFNLTNVTFNDVDFASGASCNFNVHYYLDVQVNYTNSTGIQDADVLAYDVNGTFIFNETTGKGGTQEGLISWWEFEDVSGTNAADSIGSNDGTLTGAVNWTKGKLEGGLEFDGIADYVSVGTPSSLNNLVDYSYSMWVKKAENARYAILYKNEKQMEITNADQIQHFIDCTTSNANSVSTDTITDTNWHHIVATYDNSTRYVSLYLDGVEVSYGTHNPCEGSMKDESSYALTIGYTTNPFNGSIDEVQIFNRALSATEISDIYSNSKIKRQTVLEYMQNSTQKYMKTNYTINTTDHTYWSTTTEQVNITSNFIDSSKVQLFIQDGHIDSCRDLSETATYTLSQNVAGDTTCFNITGDNIELDCDGYTINYSDSAAGYAVNNTGGFDNVTVKNCKINETTSGTNYAYGIYYKGAENGTIENNTITTESYAGHGIRVDVSSHGNNIDNNTITIPGSNAYGIYVASKSMNNSLTNNIISTSNTNGYGIYLNSNINNTFIDNNTITTTGTGGFGIYIVTGQNNTLTNNKVNTSETQSYLVFHSASATTYYNHRIDMSNLAEGYPVIYNFSISNVNLYNNQDLITTYGQIICAHCDNVTYDNLNLSNDGINLFYTTNSKIYNSNITTSKGYGIFLWSSSKYNNISNNTIKTSGDTGYGIYLLTNVDSNTIRNNNITTDGINSFPLYLANARPNFFINNTILAIKGRAISDTAGTGNEYDGNLITTLGSFGYGFYLYGSPVIIKRCNISTSGSSSYGIYFYNSEDTLVEDTVINAAGAGVADIYSRGTAGEINNFTNCTFYDTAFHTGATAEINVLWYLDAQVNYTNSTGIQDADVLAYDVNGTFIFNETTGKGGTQEGLISWWEFEDVSGTNADDSIGSNDGTLTGAVNWTKGKLEGGLEFDGIGDYILVTDADNLDGMGEITIEAWVKSKGNNFGRIIEKGDVYWFYEDGDSVNFVAKFVNVTTEVTQNVVLNCDANDTWAHLVVTYNGSQLTSYCNGVQDSTAILYGALKTDSEDLFIGCREVPDNYFNGSIDEVQIYNRALSPEEISEIYSNSKIERQTVLEYMQNSTQKYMKTNYTINATNNNIWTRHNRRLNITTNFIDSSKLQLWLNPDLDFPFINFTAPTLENASLTNNNWIYVNTTITDPTSTELQGTIDFNNSLVGWWRFEENETIVAEDWSVYGNNGTLTDFNSVEIDEDKTSGRTSAGYYGQGMRFDGVDDEVAIGNPDSTSFNASEDSFTLSAWFKINAVSVNRAVIIGKNNAYALAVDTSLKPAVYRGNAGTYHTAPDAISTGQWYHFVAVFNVTDSTIYIDGDFKSSLTIDSAPWITSNLYISGIATANFYFNGTIDEVQIHNRALSLEEINASYNAGVYRLRNNFTDLADGTYNFTAYVVDGGGHLNQTDSRTFRIVDVEATAPAVHNVTFWALNSSKTIIGNETKFNFTNLEDIEHMRVNFTLTDATGIEGDIIFYFTANGTNGCALGNRQCATCYNKTDDNWIEFKNGSTTTTFQDWGDVGDYINCTYDVISSTARNYSCTIDEHYNPNVWKHYPLNFSNVSWQSGSGQRIKKNTVWKINLSMEAIPTDADEYKLDFRVNATIGQTPTQPIEVYLCNSTYTTGNPETSVECQLVAEKLPSELQDDGTKFRGIFTKNLTQDLGNIEFVLIETDSPSAKYYSMKTFQFLGSDAAVSYISTDSGSSYSILDDGYDTELNINWFYDSTNSDTTQFVMKIFTNDTLGNDANSSNYTMSWQSGILNEPPVIDIIVPEIGSNLSGWVDINWTTAEPNGDAYHTNITIQNTTGTFTIVTNLDDTTSNYTWDTSVFDGGYNLTVISCENATSDLYCRNNTHRITIDNLVPTAILNEPQNETWANNTVGFSCTAVNVELKNISLYGNWTGTWHSNETVSVIGTTNTTNFSLSNLEAGTYVWNCYACDTSDNCAFASANRTINIDTTQPSIEFINPTLDNSTFTKDSWIYINTSVSDDSTPSNVSALIDFNNSLVGWWRFEDAAGATAADQSVYGNDGTLTLMNTGLDNNTKSGWTTSGYRGKALKFDGVDDYVTVTHDSSLSASESFTLQAWVNPTAVPSSSSYAGILYKNGITGYYVRYDVNKFVRVNTNVTWHYLVSASTLPLKTWTLLTVVYDDAPGSEVLKLYYNGNEDNTKDGDLTINTATAALEIGRGTTDDSFNGTIDEVQIFNRALSVEEINASYNAGIFRLRNNFTSLTAGETYNFTAYVVDQAGNLKQTDYRTLSIDQTNPFTEFINPTLDNSTFTKDSWIYVNTSSSDDNTNYSVTVDFNNSLVGWWRFEGNATDQSVYGNDGTESGGVVYASGKFGKGIVLEGINDYVEVPFDESFNFSDGEDFTIEAWVYLEDCDETLNHVVYKGTNDGSVPYWNFAFGFYSDEDMYFGWGDGATTIWTGRLDLNLPQNKWYHLTVGANSSSGFLYINRELNKTFSRTYNFSGLGTTLRIGGGASKYFFNGSIDEVKIYNRALSVEEINASYMANSYKYKNNFTGLSNGDTYNFTAYVVDLAGNLFNTNTRTLDVDQVKPLIEYVAPTLANATVTGNDWIYVNTSSSDDNTNYSVTVDFNNSLVGWWRFEGNATDQSVFGNDGTESGGPVYASGKFGKGLVVDGINDYVSKDNFDQSVYSDEVTVEIWAKRKSSVVNKYMFSTQVGGTGFSFYHDVTNYKGIVKDSGAWASCFMEISTGFSSDLNNWVHLTMVYNGDNLTFYRNGVSEGGDDCTGGNIEFGAGADYSIGSIAGTNFYNGTIDEVKIYNRALSPEEINASYMANTYRYEHNFTGLSDGETYNFTAYSVDLGGSLNKTLTRTMTTDTTSPTVNLISPSHGSSVTTATVTFICNSSDDGGLSNVTLIVWNSGGVNVTEQNTTVSGTVNLTSFSYTLPDEGTYTWNCRAVDTSNNNATAESNYSLTYTIPSGGGPGGEAPGGGGGAGGGGGPPVLGSFELDPKEFMIGLDENQELTEEFDITNTGEVYIFATINLGGEIVELITINSTDALNARRGLTLDETKTVKIHIKTDESGIYVGTINIKAGGISKSILISIGVGTAMSMFDAKVTIPNEYKSLEKGDPLKAEINLFRIGKTIQQDVTITYLIKDSLGNIVLEQSETFAVADQKSYIKEFDTAELKNGKYVLGIELRYQDQVAVSSDSFKIGEEFIPKLPFSTIRYIIITIFIISGILVLVIIIKVISKMRKSQKVRF